MEIQNSKSSGNIYSDFEDKFGAFFGVYFIDTIYRFEAQEIRSPKI